MRKCVGNIELHGKRLKYYVFGSRSEGYGVEITETYIEKADQVVSDNLDRAMGLARKLHRCCVFPGNLTEIVEDLGTRNNTD